MIDLDKPYRLAPGRKFRLPRTGGNVENGLEGFGGSDLVLFAPQSWFW